MLLRRLLLAAGFGFFTTATSATEKSPDLFISVERLHQLFAFGRSQDTSGLSLSEEEAIGLQRSISWEAEPKDWTIRVAIKSFAVGDKIKLPAFVQWSNNPQFRYVGIVDGRLEFRVGKAGESAYFVADVTTNADEIAEINALFKVWYERLKLDQPSPGLPQGLQSVTTTDTPIRGFSVLQIGYPNHILQLDPPYSAQELATRLSYQMEVDWFAKDLPYEHFRVSAVAQGMEPHKDAYWFDFGLFNKKANEFDNRHTLIVRPTAGGGFMLLLQNSGEKYADEIRPLFANIMETGERMALDEDD